MDGESFHSPPPKPPRRPASPPVHDYPSSSFPLTSLSSPRRQNYPPATSTSTELEFAYPAYHDDIDAVDDPLPFEPEQDPPPLQRFLHPTSSWTSAASRFVRRARRRLEGSIKWLNETWICGWIPLLNVILILVEMSVITQLVRRYDSYFDKRPIVTMMVTNTVLNGIADTVAQTVTSVRRKQPTSTTSIELEKLDDALPHPGDKLVPTDNATHSLPPPFDFPRFARFMSWGLIIAPFQFKWLQLLNRTFPLKNPAGTSATLQAMKRVACDQAVFAPVSLLAFFTYMTVAEGGSTKPIMLADDGEVEGSKMNDVLSAAKKRLENAYVPTLKANYLVWPAVQMVNFRFVPLQLQLPFASTVGIAWGTYLSSANSATED